MRLISFMERQFRERCETGTHGSRLNWFARARPFETMVWRELYRHCMVLLDPRPGERILDAGSNENIYSKAIRARSATYISLDISLSALKEFRKAEGVLCVAGDIQALPFKDNAFDKALASEVIEHVPRPLQALQELARVSRQYAVVSTAPFNGLVRKAYFALFVDRQHNQACMAKTGHLFEFGPGFVGEVKKNFWVLSLQGTGIIQFPRTAASGLLKAKPLQDTLGPVCAFLDRLASSLPFSHLLGNRIFIKFRRRS